MRGARALLLATLAGAISAVPAQSAPAVTCLVISDVQGDPTEIESPDEARAAEAYGDSADPATDVRGVRIGTAEQRLVAEIRVADIGLRRPGSPGIRWRLSWRNVDDQIAWLTAERGGNGRTTYSFDRNGDSGTAAGSVDALRDTVRIEAPAALLGIADGDRITEIQATTTELTGPAGRPRDVAPETTDYGVAYVAGVACARQDASACPVVLDKARDAGTLLHRGRTDVPDSPQALDLLAAGATSDAETVRVSARAVRPAAAPPAGYSTVGWTVSWWDGVQRWYGQAARSKGGYRFTYGIDGGDYGTATGPVPGGLSTTGRIAGRVIQIDVPRDVLGASDGTLWTQFAATGWALSDTDADELGLGEANPFRIFDETPMGRWRAGVACGA
jgi:hypothetical protein